MNWATVGKWALRIAIYAVGHADVIQQTVVDAKAKNVGNLAGDGAVIASGFIPGPPKQ